MPAGTIAVTKAITGPMMSPAQKRKLSNPITPTGIRAETGSGCRPCIPAAGVRQQEVCTTRK